MKLPANKFLALSITLSATLLTSCAKGPGAKNDPFEGYNRVMFAFNQDIDHLAVRPIAKVYKTITPTPLRKGVNNAFANLGELTTFPNDILQGNFKYAILDFWRFAINSTIGIGGLFDVASSMGMPRHTETFGMTLAKWRGGKTSPYLVLPLLGPSTVQNTIGRAADIYTQPWIYLSDKDNAIAYSLVGLNIVRTRANFLDADKLIATAFDPYVFVRDAYMQRVRLQIQKNQHLGQATENIEKANTSPEDTSTNQEQPKASS